MPEHDIAQWEHERAEIEIRNWLIAHNLWEPEALSQHLLAPPEPRLPIGMLDEDQIDELLRAETVGRIGCHADGKTYIVPVAYVYDGVNLYGQTGGGTKLRMMRANPQVCFEVEQIASLTSWRSAIVWGRFEELHGPAAERASQLLVERLQSVLGPELSATVQDHRLSPPHRAAPESVVYQITVEKRSGRYEQRTPESKA